MSKIFNYSVDMRDAPKGDVVEITERVFAYAQAPGGWFVNNTGFLVAGDGVTVIDTCATEQRTRAFADTVRGRTGLPIRRVVNTHHHGDHTYGNRILADATVIAHQGVRDALLAWGTPPEPRFWEPVDFGEIAIRAPEVTFDQGLRLYVDDVLCEVFHVGTPAHTVSDSVAWLPEERVLFAGDLLFHGVTPLMAHGSVSGALAALDVLDELSPHVVVPGHGPVGGPEMIDEVRRYLRLVQQLARDGIAAGLAPLEAARDADLGEFAGHLDPERLVGNLYRAYAEARGVAPGAQIDLDRAFADMVAYNGGRPLTCWA